jgi:ABC-2 type transport system ATP-binding protein
VTPLIEISCLTKDYGAVRAVDNLSFEVEAGVIAGFLGPNGSGKTTTLRSLLGLVTPQPGVRRFPVARIETCGSHCGRSE